VKWIENNKSNMTNIADVGTTLSILLAVSNFTKGIETIGYLPEGSICVSVDIPGWLNYQT
jgi:hypothetical protein